MCAPSPAAEKAILCSSMEASDKYLQLLTTLTAGNGVSVEQCFMVEVFSSFSILCATAKQAGLASSLAVDKTKKKSCRSTILQLDLCNEHQQSLLETWLQSPLLVWIYLAPVCGTASRAHDIRVFAGDPQPLRSNSEPEGLSNLQPEDARRVSIANALFEYACKLFHIAYSRGILATMENPRTSYFWLMRWVLQLMLAWDLFLW